MYPGPRPGSSRCCSIISSKIRIASGLTNRNWGFLSRHWRSRSKDSRQYRSHLRLHWYRTHHCPRACHGRTPGQSAFLRELYPEPETGHRPVGIIPQCPPLCSSGAAGPAGGSGPVLSQERVRAYVDIRTAFGPDETPGIFVTGDRIVIIIPTLIAHPVQKTNDLGDIISSTALVADPF